MLGRVVQIHHSLSPLCLVRSSSHFLPRIERWIFERFDYKRIELYAIWGNWWRGVRPRLKWEREREGEKEESGGRVTMNCVNRSRNQILSYKASVAFRVWLIVAWVGSSCRPLFKAKCFSVSKKRTELFLEDGCQNLLWILVLRYRSTHNDEHYCQSRDAFGYLTLVKLGFGKWMSWILANKY